MSWIQVVHHIDERTRLRSPALRKREDACARLADALAAVPGVRHVEVRPYTGSALVDHTRDVTVPAIVERACQALACDKVLAAGEEPPLDHDVPALSTLARTVVATVHEIDRSIRRQSDGTVDLGTLTTLGFIGAGALEIVGTGRMPMPPWFNLAWWGFRTFVTAEQAAIRAETEPDLDH